MIEDKLSKYRYELAIANKLVKNEYADLDYYEEIISHLKKLILFYERLKVWKDISKV